MDDIWGWIPIRKNGRSMLHIKRLRTRFIENDDFQIITVRGLGYKAVI